MPTHHLMSLSPRISPRAVRRIAAACGSGVLLLGVSACGSSGNPSGGAAGPEGGSFAQGNGGQNSTQGRFPGASGKVVAVTGSTAQVQNEQDGQVAVTWTDATTFTQQVAASLADVKVGTCVAVGAADAGAGTNGTTSAPTTITASTVRILAAGSDGTCAGGFAGGPPGAASQNGPARGSGSDSGGASGGAPGGGPSGAPGQVRGFGGTFGTVTALGAGSFTVASQVPRRDGSSSPTTTPTVVTVKVGTGTTYTKAGKATAAAVKKGVCLSARGTTGSTGAVTARTVEISAPTGGTCDGGFRRSFSGPPGGSGPATTTQES